MPVLNPDTRSAALTFARLVRSFAEREAKTIYKRSMLGWLWSLIKPLAAVLVYSLVFGVIYRAPAPATQNGKAETFALYVFSGLVVWNLFTAVVTGSMQWLKGVSDLRKKVYFPTETAILGGTVSVLLQSVLEAAVLIAFMAGSGNISWTLVYLLPALLLAAALGVGIGLVASILNTRYRDIEYLTGVLLNVALFTVPIVFTLELVPEHAYGLPVRKLMELNPLTAIVGISRDAAYFLQSPPMSRLMTASAWTCAALAAGLAYFRRRSMQISEEP